MAKEFFLEGDDYYDSPEHEHKYRRHKKERVPVFIDSINHIYPCYVYDKDGKLLRIEYPKKSEGVFKWKKWTSRY